MHQFEASMATRQPRLLVIDDASATSRRLVEQLEQLGYEVVRASDADGALAALADHEIDLVLLGTTIDERVRQHVLVAVRKSGIRTPLVQLKAETSTGAAIDLDLSRSFTTPGERGGPDG
jgi:DNA-binding response OmpR family regulator